MVCSVHNLVFGYNFRLPLYMGSAQHDSVVASFCWRSSVELRASAKLTEVAEVALDERTDDVMILHRIQTAIRTECHCLLGISRRTLLG